ncbi:unnamed protein product [Linum trigynum]|uniref:Secreted protein n=1 Tax=Linum trigynum TaxID=586398 RepID=A0AAV2FXS2_9ROSI
MQPPVATLLLVLAVVTSSRPTARQRQRRCFLPSVLITITNQPENNKAASQQFRFWSPGSQAPPTFDGKRRGLVVVTIMVSPNDTESRESYFSPCQKKQADPDIEENSYRGKMDGKR